MVHIEAIYYLVVLVVCGRTDVYYLPVQSARKLTETLEGYVELEGRKDVGWVVADRDVRHVQLGHYFPRSIILLYTQIYCL